MTNVPIVMEGRLPRHLMLLVFLLLLLVTGEHAKYLHVKCCSNSFLVLN
jgi:hypothetical protein